MSVLGSVKNRIKTMFIINQNKKKKKLNEQENSKKRILNPINKNSVFINNSVIYVKPLIKAGRLNRIIKPSAISENMKITESFNYQSKSNKVPKTVINKISPVDNKRTTFTKLENFKKLKPNIDNKAKLNNDETSIKIKKHLELFLKDTKKEIKKLKIDLLKEEEKLKKIKDKETLEKEEQEIEKIHQRILELKDILEKLTYEYDFKYYEELNDELLLKYIDDFKFKSDNFSIDHLVKKCKLEIIKIEELTNLTFKLNELEIKKGKKKETIDYLEKDYDNRYVELLKFENKTDTIKRYLKKEEDYLENLTKEINNITLDKKETSYLTFNRKYINNLFKLGIGISSFNKTFIGAYIGAFIFNNATSNLLKGAFHRDYKTNYFYKYQEFTSKIKTNIDLIDETIYLIKNSRKDITNLKYHMENTYKEYLKNPKYNEMYKQIVSMEKELIQKEEESLKNKQKLEDNNNKNKIKLKKLEEYNLNSK